MSVDNELRTKQRKPGTFEKGNQAHKGKPGGGGRPPDWLKTKCQGLFERHEVAEYVARVSAGLEEGAEHKDRLKASEMLKEWGFGKSDQPISGKLRIGLGQLIADAEVERGLNE